MNDLLVHRVARRAKAGILAVDAITLQHVVLRHWLAGDLVGDGSLDDGPVNPTAAALLLDVLEAAIDNRIERIEFALDPLWPVAAPSPRPSIMPISASRGTIAARPIAASILVPRPIIALTVAARLARPPTGTI